MKISCLFLVFLTCALAEEEKGVVRFKNGDQLTGRIEEFSVELLTWSSEVLKEPAEFGLEHIVDMTMPPGLTPPAGRAGHQASLQMTNGDSINGQLAGLNNDEIRLNTWYAGELVFRRVNVQSVEISQAADIFYRGPNSIEEWTKSPGEGGWTFKGGALYTETPAGIAREVNFPDECRIAFDASWSPGTFRPRIIFYSSNITSSNPDAGYEMVFQGNSVQMRKAGSNKLLGNPVSAGNLRVNEKARIEIRASLKSGKFLLFVDDELLEMWEDQEVDREELGKGFHIVSQDSSPLRIFNIQLAAWDGYVDEVPNRNARFRLGGFQDGFDFGAEETEIKPEQEATPEGRMVLRNGDSIAGEVTGIADEQITLKTSFTEVTFPVSRLKNIVLKPTDMETPKRMRGDVRATLADGSELVFQLNGVEDDELLGFSQNFGHARFKRGAFKRIEFNIYDSEKLAW